MHLGIRLSNRFSFGWDDPPPSGSASRRWKKHQLSREVRRTAAAQIEEQLLDEYPYRHRRNRDRLTGEGTTEAYWRHARPRYRNVVRYPFPDDHQGRVLARLWAARA